MARNQVGKQDSKAEWWDGTMTRALRTEPEPYSPSLPDLQDHSLLLPGRAWSLGGVRRGKVQASFPSIPKPLPTPWPCFVMGEDIGRQVGHKWSREKYSGNWESNLLFSYSALTFGASAAEDLNPPEQGVGAFVAALSTLVQISQ